VFSVESENGIFPTRIVLENRGFDSAPWPRNVDVIMFRFPARAKDGATIISDTRLAARIVTALNTNGWCIFFAYGSIENKLRPFQFADVLKLTGLTLVDVAVFSKPWWGGKKSDTHLTGSYEYVFMFTSAKRWYLDRSYLHDVIKGEKYEGVSCPGNSWDLARYNPAELYPQDVASSILKMICLLPGSVILDPLMGGSAGLEASVTCGYSFIGYEADLKKYNSYSKVLKKLYKLIADRDREHAIGGKEI
jgi:hypothetical protein